MRSQGEMKNKCKYYLPSSKQDKPSDSNILFRRCWFHDTPPGSPWRGGGSVPLQAEAPHPPPDVPPSGKK